MGDDRNTQSFEYERRFFVEALPTNYIVDDVPFLIVQTYFVAKNGYALRIRLQVTNPSRHLPLDMASADALEEFSNEFDSCILSVKGPYIGGTRYEAERELHIGVGLELCRAGGIPIAKERYSAWIGEDGWVIDQFAGANYPLIIAECERGGPVVDLQIPEFCKTEVTDDPRFSNDSLARQPFCRWSEQFDDELRRHGPRFLTEFGENR